MRYGAAPRALVLHHRVSVAEIDRFLMRRGAHVTRPHIDSDIAQKTEVTLMSRHPVVAVVAVLDQQLPVGPCAVGLLPGDHLHSDLGLVGDQVEVVAEAWSRRI